MELSIRLQAVANMVPNGCLAADIGTDHAHLPVFLFKNKKVKSVIAMDVAKGPLEHAQAFIKQNGLEDIISVRLSDGVSALLPEEADVVIITGMGGPLIQRIIEQGSWLWQDVNHWIISPQSEIPKTRQWLYSQGFCIIKEDMVQDMGKYYEIWDVIRGKGNELSPEGVYFGQYLLEHKHPILKQYLLKKEENLEQLIEQLKKTNSEKALIKIKEITTEYQLVKQAITLYY